jgi:predicted small metal-binding protein
MVKSFYCEDMGKDCGWSAKADTTSELMKKIIEHADTKHGIKQIPVHRKANLASTIKDDKFL